MLNVPKYHLIESFQLQLNFIKNRCHYYMYFCSFCFGFFVQKFLDRNSSSRSQNSRSKFECFMEFLWSPVKYPKWFKRPYSSPFFIYLFAEFLFNIFSIYIHIHTQLYKIFKYILTRKDESFYIQENNNKKQQYKEMPSFISGPKSE